MNQSASVSLYSPGTYQESLDRIEKLTADSQPQWGKMSVAQMLSHCAEIQEVTNGKELKNIPFVARLFKGMIRKMVVGDKPFPKSSRTHPQYVETSDRDFEAEKRRLLGALEVFVNREEREMPPHPLFGKMSTEEKGWAMYKHLDHHLSQFGV